MPFTAFGDRFRDLANRETRTLTHLHESATGVSTREYAYLELFCDEPDCDCRRVLLSVVDVARGQSEAVINFGWESESFYRDWLGDSDPDMLQALRGPALHFGPSQGPRADAILDMTKKLVLSDTAYVDRIKRHYAMFREDVERQQKVVPVVRGVKIGRNDPCPCGSGRKYKKCCEGRARDVDAD